MSTTLTNIELKKSLNYSPKNEANQNNILVNEFNKSKSLKKVKMSKNFFLI